MIELKGKKLVFWRDTRLDLFYGCRLDGIWRVTLKIRQFNFGKVDEGKVTDASIELNWTRFSAFFLFTSTFKSQKWFSANNFISNQKVHLKLSHFQEKRQKHFHGNLRTVQTTKPIKIFICHSRIENEWRTKNIKKQLNEAMGDSILRCHYHRDIQLLRISRNPF